MGAYNNIYLDEFGATVQSGDTWKNTKVYGGITFTVNPGGKANFTSVAGLMRLFGQANSTTLIGVGGSPLSGYLHVFSGGTASNTTIYADNSMGVAGSADMTSVCSGFLHISSGGIATRTAVLGGGRVYVSSGGVLSRITVNNGARIDILSCGQATSASILSGGVVFVSCGQLANTQISYGGRMEVLAGVSVSSADVYSDGHLVSTIISSARTVIRDTVVSGGTMSVCSGSILTGSMKLSGGARVSVASGVNIDFSLVDISPDNSAFFNDLSSISGWENAVYTVSVFVLKTGVYKLADNVSQFDKTITVQNKSGSRLGMIKLGTKYTINGHIYKLFLSGRVLSLDVTVLPDDTPPSISIYPYITSLTNQDVAVSAYFSDNVTLKSKQYKIGPDGQWQTYVNGVTVSRNTTVYFKAIDHVDNETYASCTISNIDKVRPVVSNITPNRTLQTDQTVTVTADFSDDVKLLSGLYRLSVEDDGQWHTYENGVTVSRNMTIFFKAVDSAGNESEIASYSVKNIKKTGTSNGVCISAGQIELALNGDQYNGTTVLSQGLFWICSGGIANSATISAGAMMTVSSGGKASGISVNKNGMLTVLSGGTVTNIRESGGYVSALDGATVSFAPCKFYALHLLSSESATVHSGTVVSNASVYSGARLEVYRGGSANSVTVGSGGNVTIESGGTVTSIRESGGYVSVLDGATVSFESGTLSSLTLSGLSATVHSGTTANSATIFRSGYLDVCGGIANATLISGGTLHVRSGGTAVNNTLKPSDIGIGHLYVFSGGVANSTTIESKCSMYISSGGTVNVATVNFGGTVSVFSGATATRIQENGGWVSVQSGANVTFVSSFLSGLYLSNHCATVHSGTTANSTMIDFGGALGVYSGGTANVVSVGAYGSMGLLSGGTANSVSVDSQGKFIVDYGGTANNTLVSGGQVYNTIANDLGSFFVYGTANDTEVSSGGLMTVFSGGTANNTTVHDVGRFLVSSGGVANNATVNGGYFIVCSGGKATGRMIVSSGATAYVSSGGIIDFDITEMGYNAPERINDLSLISSWTNAVFTLTVSDTQANGRFALANGAYEFNKTITVRSTSGATLGTLTVGSTLNIRGTDCILTLNNGELALTYGIPPDCVAPTVFNVMADIVDPTNRDVTVTAMFSDDEALAQSLYRIGPGGVWQSYVNGVTVSENTTVYFKAVDVAGNESEVATYNVVNIDKVAPTVSDIQADVLYPTLNTVTVTAAFADNVALSKKLYRVGKTDEWNNYTSGVTVSENTTVYFKAADAAGNESEVASYTVANIKVISGAVVSSGYSRIVSSGFIYVDPIISSGGRMIVLSGGSVRRTTLTPGAHMAVSSGGRASEIMENGGSINVEDNASATFVPNTISGLVLSVYTGRASVHSGTTATSATIRAGGGLGVYSGGTANNTAIYSGGTLYLYGGTVNSTTQYHGGFMVFSASEVYDTVLNSGWIYLYDGSLNRTNVNGGFFSAYKGTTLSDTTISGGYGYCSGTMAGITTICSGGSLYIASNGILAGQVNISSGGSIILSSGASVYLNLSGLTPGATARITNLSRISGLERASFTISLSDLQTDGTYVIAEGASGFNRMISVRTPYGNCSVSAGYTTFLIDSYYTLSLSGGTLSLTCSKGTIVRSGRRVVSSGWTSDGISVLSAGGYYVFSDGTANDTEVNSGGYMYVLSDGTANDTEVDSGGSMYVSSGGTANYTTVSSGGVLSVISGGTANFTTVSSGGVMIVYTGGVCRLNEQSRIKNYARVSAFSGAVFDFDISETDSVTTACIENLSRITGVLYANYVITVSNSQSDGTYTLADGATGFNKTISVVNTSGEELGSLSIGETTTIGGTDYTLNLNNGTLSVTLSGSTPPEPEPELPANTHFFPGCFAGGTQAMLAKRTDRTVTVYQNGEEWGLGVAMDYGWEVVGVGDFSGDGADDFLRVNYEGYVVGEMSNGNGTFSPHVLNFLNEGWSILGVGDFNGNGTDDVLIANPTAASETVGLLGYWESGVTWTLINGYSPEWECVATGDFNGDGKCDMLWKNSFEGEGGLTYNAYCTWIVDDPVDWRMVSVANPAEWNFLCSGDFDGDKMNDIAMINDVGVVGIWGVNDGYLSSWSILSAVTPEWTLAGVADFNGDGTDDIAWANTDTGLVGCWQIENKELVSWQTIVNLA